MANLKTVSVAKGTLDKYSLAKGTTVPGILEWFAGIMDKYSNSLGKTGVRTKNWIVRTVQMKLSSHHEKRSRKIFKLHTFR